MGNRNGEFTVKLAANERSSMRTKDSLGRCRFLGCENLFSRWFPFMLRGSKVQGKMAQGLLSAGIHREISPGESFPDRTRIHVTRWNFAQENHSLRTQHDWQYYSTSDENFRLLGEFKIQEFPMFRCRVRQPDRPHFRVSLPHHEEGFSVMHSM